MISLSHIVLPNVTLLSEVIIYNYQYAFVQKGYSSRAVIASLPRRLSSTPSPRGVPRRGDNANLQPPPLLPLPLAEVSPGKLPWGEPHIASDLPRHVACLEQGRGGRGGRQTTKSKGEGTKNQSGQSRGRIKATL